MYEEINSINENNSYILFYNRVNKMGYNYDGSLFIIFSINDY